MNPRNLSAFFFLHFLTTTISSGAQWERVQSIPVGDVASFHIADDTFYAGVDNTIHISTDSGVTWSPTSQIPANGAFIDTIILFNGKIFAGTGGSGIFMSSNQGVSWQSMNDGLSGPGSHHISAFAIRGGVLCAGTSGSGVFTLSGSTWLPFGDLTSNAAGTVNTLAVLGDSLVAGAGGNGYTWFSTPGSSTFNGVPVGPFPGDIFLVISFLRHGGFLFAGTNYGVYRSDNGGASWTFAGTGIPNGRHVALTAHGSTLFAAASSAGTRVLRSTNLGLDWETVDNIPFAYATKVFDNRLYAARIDGLWYLDLLPTPVKEQPLPHDVELGQNYPNPFNPNTIIEYRQSTSGSVTLKVFDVLGREVTTLVNEMRGPGDHAVEWNAESMSGGVYFYRLTIGAHSITKRMLLVK